MIGIFQIFSISFLFWMLISSLRFVFDTLNAFKESSSARGRLNFFVISGGGVSVSIALFLILFFEFGFDEFLYVEGVVSEISLVSLVLWLACVGVGSYLATRLYMYRSYAIASAVSAGSTAAGLTLVALALGEEVFTGEAILWLGGGAVVTTITGLLGGHVAEILNVFEQKKSRARAEIARQIRIKPSEVAVVIAAHNEELSIGSTIQSLLQLTSPDHIYIGSDGSTDKTVEKIRSFGCHADDIQPNHGKAGALTYVLKHNNIFSRYKAVFLLDADITVDPAFYQFTLPYLDDPRVAAVSGYFSPVWPRHFIPRWELLVTAYRIRLWRVLQFLVRYGQTWRYVNESPIIPGGGSVYRTSVLEKISIDAPGLVIEDFNMTFEVHRQKLGLIIFEPRVLVHNQEPYSIPDFIRQIKRWYLGYFQTMRRHGIWLSPFCFFTYFFTLELLISSFLFLLVPFLLLELVLGNRDTLFLNFIVWGYPITLFSLFIGALVFDYLITIGVAIVERKPLLLLYGLAFFPLRYIESVVFLLMLPLAFLRMSDGRWVSPKRRAHEL